MSVVRGLRGINTRADVDRLVHRETARADRTGHEFSLVLFRVKSQARFSISSQRLVKTVLNRVRATDEVGWFDEKHLCVVLPDTGVAGAWRFAEDVCDLIACRNPRPIFVVYSYPTDWLDGVSRAAGSNEPERRGGSTKDDHDNRGGGGGGGGGNGRGGNGRRETPAAIAATNGHVAAITATLDRASHAPQIADAADAVVVTEPSAESGGVATLTETAVAVADQSTEDDESRQSTPMEHLLLRKMPIWKRSIDIAGASVGILLAAPLLIFAAAAIKITEPQGPIIFKQRRSGLGGQPFWIFKFRTMCVGAEKMRDALKQQSEQDGPAFKMKHDPRVTRIGRFLRRSSIDELPQLFNILRGDMTLVGPRPLPISEQTACEMWQRRRLDVTPGLTCIWQVKGRSQVTFADWMRMDLQYIRRRTLWHDVSLIAQTVKSVLMRRGAV